MAIGRIWLWLLLVCLGCQTLVPLDPPDAGEPARLLWEKGQEAMRQGKADDALDFYRRSLAADPGFTRNHLSIAAALLEKGDEFAALPHLARYVRAHPDQFLVRLHLAELLVRIHHLDAARTEFEGCVAGAQDKGDSAANQLIHCHAQLMEIAEDEEDEYHEHLHRGIGLYLLGRQRSALANPDGDLSSEELLCKSAGELTLAHLDRPDEARPNWYLHEVWSLLAQGQTARRCLQKAEETAPFTYLTAAEKRDLRLACQCQCLDRSCRP
jgi:tetratricopeptide (TPR) repeat protein